ncbi:hypothetical protein DSO57_1016742 [Entomophthora muscae]|uniref:Uncharacterized protein n=1 Tax=Entomophthora muscae TaxID=34485 RepID=A0ACC2TSD0_9FUNG|nr:hypothetical protein DSO57_1016742 [Entomophthora muscae]
MAGLPALIRALTPEYAGLLRDSEPCTLEEAHAESIAKKEASTLEALEARLKDITVWFENIFLTQEQPGPCGSRAPRFDESSGCVYNPPCYNCDQKGHVLWNCITLCSICKEPNHSNFVCQYNRANRRTKPQEILMSEVEYGVIKCGLSSSASSQSLNKQSRLAYIINPSSPKTLPPKIVVPRPISIFVCASAPSPVHEDPVTYAREDCEEAPSPETPGLTNPHSSPVPPHIKLESPFQ